MLFLICGIVLTVVTVKLGVESFKDENQDNPILLLTDCMFASFAGLCWCAVAVMGV